MDLVVAEPLKEGLLDVERCDNRVGSGRNFAARDLLALPGRRPRIVFIEMGVPMLKTAESQTHTYDPRLVSWIIAD